MQNFKFFSYPGFYNRNRGLGSDIFLFTTEESKEIYHSVKKNEIRKIEKKYDNAIIPEKTYSFRRRR